MPILDLFALDEVGSLRLRAETSEELCASLDPAILATLGSRGLLALCAHLAAESGLDVRGSRDQRARLDASLQAGRAASLRWQEGIELALEACARIDVVPTLFKGADLAFHAYPAPGLRDMVDVDLLVPRQRLEEVGVVLAEVGFGEVHLSFSREWYVNCRDVLPPLVHAQLGVQFDIHGSLMPPYSPYRVAESMVAANLESTRWPRATRLAPWLSAWQLAVHAHVMHLGDRAVLDRLVLDLLVILGPGAAGSGEQLTRLAVATRTAFAVAGALEEVIAVPGASSLRPLATKLSGHARKHRPAEAAAHGLHLLRHAAPFLRLGRPLPPDAFRQFAGRPWRRLKSILGRTS